MARGVEVTARAAVKGGAGRRWRLEGRRWRRALVPMEHRADRCSPRENDLISREAADVVKVLCLRRDRQKLYIA